MHPMGKYAYRICALYALPLLWSISQAAPSASSQPFVIWNALGGACGQHYDEIAAAVKAWQSKPALTPENEAKYTELKERCRQAQEERMQKLAAINDKLPKSMVNVVSALSQLNVTLKEELDTLEATVRNQHGQLEQAWQHGVQLQRELLLTNVESDRIERALFYHSLLQNSSPAQLVAQSYKYHGANGKMVARLLKFVRSLPAWAERVDAYKELEGQLKGNGQNERFPAVIFSQDVKEHGKQDSYAPDHAQFGEKAVARWQALLLAGNFSEIVLFARDYPAYYARIEAELLGALGRDWSTKALEQASRLPNALPHPAQRVAALKAVLEALLQHQDKQHNDPYLMQLAHQLAKLEQDLATEPGAAADTKEALGAVKELFGKFSYQRDFPTYVELYGMFKNAL